MTATGNLTTAAGVAAKIWPRTTRLGPGTPTQHCERGNGGRGLTRPS
jgi:hypothetical protein